LNNNQRRVEEEGDNGQKLTMKDVVEQRGKRMAGMKEHRNNT
jgi:hypothetical protein